MVIKKNWVKKGEQPSPLRERKEAKREKDRRCERAGKVISVLAFQYYDRRAKGENLENSAFIDKSQRLDTRDNRETVNFS